MTETAEMTETVEAVMTAEATTAVEATAEVTATVETAAEVVATETVVPQSPEDMPTSGGELTGGSLTLSVVMAVLAFLAAGAFVTRRRPA